MTVEQASDGTTIIVLPADTHLGSAFLHADTWAAYDQIDWEETMAYDPGTGAPKPHKAFGPITVFPPVNVPRDGEFGVRRDLVR